MRLYTTTYQASEDAPQEHYIVFGETDEEALNTLRWELIERRKRPEGRIKILQSVKLSFGKIYATNPIDLTDYPQDELAVEMAAWERASDELHAKMEAELNTPETKP